MHPRRDRESNHAENLQRKVLGGRVDIERTDINYPSFSWKPDGWSRSLSLLNVSSMVSELIPVALYLNHMVDRGDLLILEEPEAHLHPARQVDLIREVAAWVRGGVRVLLTTHSEWVLEALSNLVGEGEVDDSAGLRKDQVGLWHFDPPKSKRGGSKIREVPWNEDEGGFVTGYEDVAADLHNRWADLVGGNE